MENQKNFILNKEIFEKIKTLLTAEQKRYVELEGYRGVAEKGIDVFLKTFFWNLVILGLFFLYLINFEGVKFYDQLAEDKKFYTILFIILYYSYYYFDCRVVFISVINNLSNFYE